MIIPILVALVLAGLALWACSQLPLDATIQRIIKVVVVVAVVLFILHVALGGHALLR